MIQAIGLMMGFYIITRMVSFLFRKEQRQESLAVKIFSAITILVAIFSIVSLMMVETPRMPRMP